jgi:hypothetical protein
MPPVLAYLSKLVTRIIFLGFRSETRTCDLNNMLLYLTKCLGFRSETTTLNKNNMLLYFIKCLGFRSEIQQLETIE